MSNDPKNIRLGPCRVRFAGKDLGLTKGGVDVTLKTDTHQVQVDQFGLTPVDEYITGRTLTVKVPFAETDIDNIYAILKNSASTFVDDGTKATGTITFSAKPSANDSITVNGHTFTFVAAPTVAGPSGGSADQIAIGSDEATCIKNAVAVISASSDPKVQDAVYAATATTMTITYFQSGLAGNSFTTAVSGTSMTVAGATLTGGTDATHRRVEVQSGVGVSLLTTAAELLLHPKDKADDDYSEDFVVPLANTAGNFSFSYKLDAERVFTLDFTGYPDPTSTTLFTYGNKW